MPDHSPITILVVDDTPATLYSTSRVLKSAGFNVITAQTGADAIEKASHDPNLVILDINLPDIDGFEICRRLRGMERMQRVPVIYLSASFVKDGDKVQGLDAGADGYLTHPVEPRVLTATVNAFLRARQAEDAMRRSEAKFKAIFEQALSGISLLSEQMIYLEVNPAMCRILGRPREEIVGKHLSAFTPDAREEEVTHAAQALASTGSWRSTFPLIRADGSRVELDWSISIHSVPGVRLAIVTDVTERKQNEAEREELLHRERVARAEAERANRLKDDFLATLSHELRTPLNAIVGWSQLLKQTASTDPEMVDGIDAIERNARVQAQLIEDLLDVSRITSGKLQLKLESIDPAVTIEAALEGCMAAAQAKNIEVVRELDAATGPILCDAARLQQVVWNLVNNAVKFTPRGGQVRVGLRRSESSVQISVSDNGQGIRLDFLPHLFERFRQEDASTTRGHGGLGLGLAIVKHLVEMHGGSVTAESEGEGKGATFHVRLPVAAVSAELMRVELGADELFALTQASLAGPKQKLDLTGIRILVVDDDQDARTVIRRVLKPTQADVTDAANVPAALEAIELFKPHILISDIGMPVQDGFDLIRQVREKGLNASVLPAIALTAFARDEDLRKAIAAGYQMHLTKPVSADALLKAIAAMAPDPDAAVK